MLLVQITSACIGRHTFIGKIEVLWPPVRDKPFIFYSCSLFFERRSGIRRRELNQSLPYVWK